MTREDVQKLKRDWTRDSCWDIEETEGFEEYRVELLDFRIEQEARWSAIRNAEYHRKSEQIGVPGNLTLAAYILRLEGRIAQLEEGR